MQQPFTLVASGYIKRILLIYLKKEEDFLIKWHTSQS